MTSVSCVKHNAFSVVFLFIFVSILEPPPPQNLLRHFIKKILLQYNQTEKWPFFLYFLMHVLKNSHRFERLPAGFLKIIFPKT